MRSAVSMFLESGGSNAKNPHKLAQVRVSVVTVELLRNARVLGLINRESIECQDAGFKNGVSIMTDYVIEIHNPLGDFTQIPNSLLNDERLSAEAVALMCWFLQNRTGWIIRQSDARKRFRWGKDRWQRVMRELREVGAVQSVDERDLKTGRVVAWRMVISALPWVTGERLDAPKNTPKVQRPDNPACGATTERSQRPDNPACGPDNPAGSGRIIRPLNKTTLAAAARAPKACAAAAAANKAENLGVLWARAEQAASQGLRWRNPESQTWHCAAEWGQGVD